MDIAHYGWYLTACPGPKGSGLAPGQIMPMMGPGCAHVEDPRSGFGTPMIIVMMIMRIMMIMMILMIVMIIMMVVIMVVMMVVMMLTMIIMMIMTIFKGFEGADPRSNDHTFTLKN